MSALVGAGAAPLSVQRGRGWNTSARSPRRCTRRASRAGYGVGPAFVPADKQVVDDATFVGTVYGSAVEDRRPRDGNPGWLPSPLMPAVGASAVRKTKIVATVGPASNSREALFKLLDCGVNVVRLNMSHGDHASHRAVVDLVREYNESAHTAVALMLDTKGPEVRSGDLATPLVVEPGERLTFTIQAGADGRDRRVSVNYDGFISDVGCGDVLLVDGGLISARVIDKTDTDVHVEVVDGGELGSRRHLNVRGKSATLPAITPKDWLDLQFGVDVQVDYFALSFVQDGEVVREVKRWLAAQGARVGVIAKIESASSVQHLDDILDAVDGAMVARGDLGAELAPQDVPYWQSKIVHGCRRRGKPVIVATNMLESMVANPTPTRAEVSDIAIAVREGADAVMLSGETAYGKFPYKAVAVQAKVARRTEAAMATYHGLRRSGSEDAPPIDWIVPPSRRQLSPSEWALSEMFAYHATTMANTLRVPLLVFSRHGNMPALLSHYRPDLPIYAFTDSAVVRSQLALYHGVVACAIQLSGSAESCINAALEALAARGHLALGGRVALVQSGRKPIWRDAATHTIQLRKIEERHVVKEDDSDD